MLTLEFRNDVDELLAYCKECIEKKDYMTVFRLDDENNKDNEIDVAILNALMKGFLLDLVKVNSLYTCD